LSVRKQTRFVETNASNLLSIVCEKREVLLSAQNVVSHQLFLFKFLRTIYNKRHASCDGFIVWADVLALKRNLIVFMLVLT